MPSTSAFSMLVISTSHGSEKSPRASSRISGSSVSITVFRDGSASKYSLTHGSSTPSSLSSSHSPFVGSATTVRHAGHVDGAPRFVTSCCHQSRSALKGGAPWPSTSPAVCPTTASTCSPSSRPTRRCASRSTRGSGTRAPSTACPASASRRSPTSGRPTTSSSTSRSPTGASSTCSARGKVHDPLGADGKARILGAGPIEFELVKPFEHWKARIQGDASVTSIEAQIGGAQPGTGTGEVVPVELEYDIRSAAPPWESGSLARGRGSCARHPGGGRPHGWPPLRAAVPRHRHAARRRRRVLAQRRRPAHPPRRCPSPRRVPRARVAVDGVPERARASACASIRRATTARTRSTRGSCSKATAS